MPPTVFASSPLAMSPAKSPAKRRRAAARCLFGSPDHDQTKQWIHEQLAEIERAKMHFWNYDFRADQPLTPTTAAIDPPAQEILVAATVGNTGLLTPPASSGDGATGAKWNWIAKGSDTVPRFYWKKTVTSPSPPEKKHQALLQLPTAAGVSASRSKENLRSASASASRLRLPSTFRHPKSVVNENAGSSQPTTPRRKQQQKMPEFFPSRKRLPATGSAVPAGASKSPRKSPFVSGGAGAILSSQSRMLKRRL